MLISIFSDVNYELECRHVGPPASQHKIDSFYNYYQPPAQQGYHNNYHAPDYSRQTTGISMSSQGSEFRRDVPRGDVLPVHHAAPSFSSHYVQQSIGLQNNLSMHSQQQPHPEEIAG